MVTEILKVSNAGKLYSALKYCFRRCQIEATKLTADVSLKQLSLHNIFSFLKYISLKCSSKGTGLPPQGFIICKLGEGHDMDRDSCNWSEKKNYELRIAWASLTTLP